MAGKVSCPKCGEKVARGGYYAWQYAIMLLTFPVGIVAFLIDRKPSVCKNCGTSF